MGQLNRNKIKIRLRSVLRIKTWQLVLLLILFGFVAATLLRLDNLEMTRLREAVLIADYEGDTEDILRAVDELRTFVFTHTVISIVEENGIQSFVLGTGPFYLEHQYTRTAHREIERARQQLEAGQDGSGGESIFDQAASRCDALARQFGWRSWTAPHVDCVLNELARHPEMDAIQDLTTAMIPSTALYFHNYVAPIWAPTPAGWVMLNCLILISVIIVRILTSVFLRLLLRFSRPKDH